MLNSRSLLVRPHPLIGEGPRGYMLRLAEANWISGRELAAWGLIYDPHVLLHEGLLPDFSINPELHRNVAYQSDCLFNQCRVWNQKFARFCPQCLAEDGYWRSGWELLFHDACPVHGTWLVDQCSTCNEKLTWDRESLLRCKCGADLRTEPYSESPESVRWLSEVLSRKLRNDHGADTHFPEPLEQTNLEQTQRLIRFLGSYMNSQAGRNPLKIQQAGSLASSWGVTTLAGEILHAWPESFHRALESIQTDVPHEESRQLGSVFGRAYHYLYRGLIGAAFNPVRDEFETWLSYSWRGGLAKRNRRLAFILLQNATWIPASLAREKIGISHQRLLRLIREGVIDGEVYHSKAGREFVMVRRDQLELVRESLDGYMDMKAAGAALGLSKKRMRQILTLLFPHARKAGVSTTSPWHVSRSEIESLINIGASCAKACIPDEDCVSLRHILRYWAWSAREIGSLIAAAKDGELKLVACLDGEVGISGWVFKERMLKEWQAKSVQGFGAWLTIPQMAKLLGIKQQVAYDIVNNDFIHAEAIHLQPRGGVRIRRTEVERFKGEYVFCTEIAQRLGISPRKAKSILADLQIHPISGPSIDAARQLLYLRNLNLENAMAKLGRSSGDDLSLI